MWCDCGLQRMQYVVRVYPQWFSTLFPMMSEMSRTTAISYLRFTDTSQIRPCWHLATARSSGWEHRRTPPLPVTTWPQTFWINLPRMVITKSQTMTLLNPVARYLVASSLVAVGDNRAVVGNSVENEMAVRMFLIKDILRIRRIDTHFMQPFIVEL